MMRYLVIMGLMLSSSIAFACMGGEGAADVGVPVVDLDGATSYSPYLGEWAGAFSKQNGVWLKMGKESSTPLWMRGFDAPLDFVFFNRDLHVVQIYERTQPQDKALIGSGAVYWYVLIAPAGIVQKLHIQVGDGVMIDHPSNNQSAMLWSLIPVKCGDFIPPHPEPHP